MSQAGALSFYKMTPVVSNISRGRWTGPPYFGTAVQNVTVPVITPHTKHPNARAYTTAEYAPCNITSAVRHVCGVTIRVLSGGGDRNNTSYVTPTTIAHCFRIFVRRARHRRAYSPCRRPCDRFTVRNYLAN